MWGRMAERIGAPMQSTAPSVFPKVTHTERKRWLSFVSWSKY